MSVQLLAIKFNHDPNSATADALNIRKNRDTWVNVPEWERGVSVTPSDSLAAYAVSEVAGNTLTIKAKLRRTDPALQFVEVRAIDADAEPQPEGCGCSGWLLWLLRAIARALFGNVNILGDVKARQVTFTQGDETAFETFELTGRPASGVRADTIGWRWQYRLGGSISWVDFETTRHTIYSILELPKDPWQQTPYDQSNPELPWTEVLDYACSWARLSGTLDTAAGRITENVFALGPATVEYDCPTGGRTKYAYPHFFCTAFLELLRGGAGRGKYVNCSDCATIVSTFANILGCDLWQSRMGGDWFALNHILAIGSSVWQTACNWGGFSYHEVAWKGACTSNENIFDACLKVDGDADPTTAPHTALLPVDMRFGNTGDGDYRDRLASPAGRPTCGPDPASRRRRFVV